MGDCDEAKRQRTLQDRGVDLTDVARFDFGTAEIRPDLLRDNDEARLLAIGLLGGRLQVPIFTPRAGGMRIFNLRRANARQCKT